MGSVDPSVRRFIDRIDPVADVFDTVSMYRDMTLEERGKLLAALCRSAIQIVVCRPDRDAVLAFQDPMSPEAEATWLALIRRGRRGAGA